MTLSSAPIRGGPAAVVAAALAAVSIAALAVAFTAQWGFGLQPCVLCLWQRWPYAVVIALAGAALVLPGRPGLQRLLIAGCGIAFLVGAGIAAFHVGVEQHWWAGSDACTGNIGGARTVEDLRAQLAGAPVVRCDEVAFAVLGISMAGWNGLLSLVLGVGSLAAAWRLGAVRQ